MLNEANDGRSPAAVDGEEAKDASPGWKFVRLLWCDASGIRRVRVLPAWRWKEISFSGLGVAFACMFLPSHADACPPDPAATPVGEMRLIPAQGTLRVLPWHPSHAVSMVKAVPETDVAGPAWECCPRSALERVLQQAQEQHGITVKAGFESEFILLDKARQQQQAQKGCSGLPPPFDESNYCLSSAFGAAATVLDAVCDALHGLGIELEQLHPESAPGQFEVATRYGEAMQACDNVLLTREAITAVAAQHGLVATFLPKLWPDAAGNGCHCHFSLWQGEHNLMADLGDGQPQQVPPIWEAFLAGVLHNLPALLCFISPSPNSFRRLQPSCWSGAYQCWGVQNREAALRLASTPGSPNSSNCEIKAFDATANPYIGLAAVLVAGMEGLRLGLELPSPLSVDPGTLSAAELAAHGIKRLPADLGQALEALRKNRAFRSALNAALGETLVRAFLAVRQAEWDAFGGKSIEDEACALYMRY